jgi:putative ubiquitin-RnfH superfamily antitoxin RatB of RatAB toxin-antitoxin module
MIRLEVVYATAGEQTVLPAQVPPGATVEAAIRASGMLQRYPEIDLRRTAVGIFGERVTLDARVATGDRVEIYRPLLADPKEARRRREQRRSRDPRAPNGKKN